MPPSPSRRTSSYEPSCRACISRWPFTYAMEVPRQSAMPMNGCHAFDGFVPIIQRRRDWPPVCPTFTQLFACSLATPVLDRRNMYADVGLDQSHMVPDAC